MKNSLMEIREFLDKNNIDAEEYHFDILKRMDLSNEKTLEDLIEIEKRYIDSPNKFSEEIMVFLRLRRGMDEYDTEDDEIINKMSKSEAFDNVVSWNNLPGWSGTLKKWVKEIYGVDLDKISKEEN